MCVIALQVRATIGPDRTRQKQRRSFSVGPFGTQATRRMAPQPLVLALALAAAPLLSSSPLASAQLATYQWTADGGSPFRTNSATVAVALGGGASGARATFSQLNGEEDTESLVEEVLLPSPLVTSFGAVLFAADNCTLMLYPDPALLTAGQAWQREAANWDVLDAFRGPNEESQMAGTAMFRDRVFVLDARNKAVHAVDVLAATGFGYHYRFQRAWTAFINITRNDGGGSVDVKFTDGNTGMIPEAQTNLLWVPLATDYAFASAGLAATLDMTTGAVSYVLIPDELSALGCAKPNDMGSVAVDNGAVVLISSDGPGASCGLVILDPTGAPLYNTLGEDTYLFNLGEHSHPLFDADSSSLYWLDFELQIQNGRGQRLCCVNTAGGAYDNCWGTNLCVTIPAFEVVDEKVDIADYRWLWLSMALQPASADGSTPARLLISASATENDETFLYNGVEDLTSALFAYDTTTGILLDQHRFKRDMFNSAPLVATGTDGAVRVYVSTTLGFIYCYAASSIAAGPQWTSQDLAPIPLEDLPLTTYTFLSVTQKGTLLATSTAGGANWQTQKATFAIQNGLLAPSAAAAAAASGALSPPAAAGVSIVGSRDPLEAVRGAHAIVTDTWVSMGQEAAEAARKAAFKGYQVTHEMARRGGAREDWCFLHCLPRKPEEVDDAVFYDEKRSLVFEEAVNRKWTVMATCLALLEGGADL